MMMMTPISSTGKIVLANNMHHVISMSVGLVVSLGIVEAKNSTEP